MDALAKVIQRKRGCKMTECEKVICKMYLEDMPDNISEIQEHLVDIAEILGIKESES